MCGLWGIISSTVLTSREEDLVMLMGKLSEHRGIDSTGVLAGRLPWASEKSSYYFSLEKDVCSPSYFANRKAWETIKRSSHHFLIGHNRHATVGKITKKAAHPYQIGNPAKLIGTHNGTLKNYLTDKCGHDTDSEKFFTNVSKDGLKPTLESLGINSAYALVYVTSDGKGPIIHFFRNSQRTLWYALSQDRKSMVYASEARIIKSALAMHETLKYDEPKSFDTNTLYKIKLVRDEKIKVLVKKDFLDEEKIKEHEKKYEEPARTYPTHYSGSGNTFHHNNSRTHPFASNTYYKPSFNVLDVQYISLINGVFNVTSKSGNIQRVVPYYPIHRNYRDVMDMWEKWLFLIECEAPYIRPANDRFDSMEVMLPPTKKDISKGKIRTKRVVDSYHHARYEGWMELWIKQDNLLKRYLNNEITPVHAKKYIREHFKDFNKLRRDAVVFQDLYDKENKNKNTEQDKKVSYEIGNSVHPLDRVRQILASGCQGCGTNLSLNDTVFWQDNETPMCSGCESTYGLPNAIRGKVSYECEGIQQ